MNNVRPYVYTISNEKLQKKKKKKKKKTKHSPLNNLLVLSLYFVGNLVKLPFDVFKLI